MEVSEKPDWSGLQKAFDSENPEDEIIIIAHRWLEMESGEPARQIHVMHNLKEPRGKMLVESLINNALNGQPDVDMLIDVMGQMALYAKQELHRLRTLRAQQN